MSFVYIDYPTAGYILNILMREKVKSNVEKLQVLKQVDFKVGLR